MPRIKFYSVFEQIPEDAFLPEGGLLVKQDIRVGGVTMFKGLKLGKGISLGGIDFNHFLGHELEFRTDGGILMITGIFEK